MDALLLGCRTYDIFAAYWPHQDRGIAKLFNRLPRHVASHQAPTLEWAGSTLLGADVVGAVRNLRDRHASIHVNGSLNFVQTLFADRLLDRLTLFGCSRSSSAVERRSSPTEWFNEPQSHRTGDLLAQGRRAATLRAHRRHTRRRRDDHRRPECLNAVPAIVVASAAFSALR
ncbi:dihydrofolate reductase family protein [Pseudarthrobacter sp. So.54]